MLTQPIFEPIPIRAVAAGAASALVDTAAHVLPVRALRNGVVSVLETVDFHTPRSVQQAMRQLGTQAGRALTAICSRPGAALVNGLLLSHATSAAARPVPASGMTGGGLQTEARALLDIELGALASCVDAGSPVSGSRVIARCLAQAIDRVCDDTLDPSCIETVRRSLPPAALEPPADLPALEPSAVAEELLRSHVLDSTACDAEHGELLWQLDLASWGTLDGLRAQDSRTIARTLRGLLTALSEDKEDAAVLEAAGVVSACEGAAIRAIIDELYQLRPELIDDARRAGAMRLTALRTASDAGDVLTERQIAWALRRLAQAMKRGAV